jgi:hypothetical protein
MDNTGEELKRLRQLPASPFQVAPSIQSHSFETEPMQDASLSSIPSTPTETSPSDIPIRYVSSPIQEEDEDQLFPLPSPRRSPASSKVPSPIPSPKPSPLPSPNLSVSSLSSIPPPVPKGIGNSISSLNVSATSLLSIPPPVPKYIGTSSSMNRQDGLLPNSISRKTSQPRDILRPYNPNQAPVLPPLSISNGFSAAFDWGSHDTSFMVNASRKPRPQPLILTSTTKTLGSSVPTSQIQTQISSTRERKSLLTAYAKPLPTIPRSHYNPPLPSPPHTPSSPTPPRSPTRYPASATPRKTPFPLPFFDVLKGVNSMSGGAGGVGLF